MGRRMSRRAMVTGLAAASVLSRAARAESAASVDVAIVGAGAAGIGAARALARAGRSHVVLEASRRPGGRVFTDTSLGEPFDAGALYIHFAERNPWMGIAREFGVPTEPTIWSPGPRVMNGGAEVGEAEVKTRQKGFTDWMKLMNAFDPKDDADLSFADLAEEGGPFVRRAARSMAAFAVGEDAERVSVADYWRLWGGGNEGVRAGYGTLVARAAQDLDIRYETPVTRIAWGGPGVRLTTPKGEITARTAIVTVSIGVLKAGRIAFDPPLPASHKDALSGMAMGALTKIALKFDDRLGLPTPTTLIDIGRAAEPFNAEFWRDDRALAVCHIGGDLARRLARAGEPAAIDYALSRVAAMAGAHVKRHFVGGRLAGWSADPLFEGGYSYCKVGHAKARKQLRKPLAERLRLIGEATAGRGSMTAGGATLVATRIAGRIVAALEGLPAPDTDAEEE